MMEDKDLAYRLGRAAFELEISLFDRSIDIRSNDHPAFIELLVHKAEALRIKIDGCKNHPRPHVHIDIGKDYHAASYAIDNGELLAGDPYKFGDRIEAWIAENKDLLLEAWEAVHSSDIPGADERADRLRQTDFPKK
jgi:hypothetical protein